MVRGKFISIEGTEGAGKSTALQFIHHFLETNKIPVVLTREPGGTPVAEEIRKVLLHPASSEAMTPETELLLMFASRAQHIQHCIQPALSQHKWVVCDRYVDASYAYQGSGRGIALERIEMLDKLVVKDCYPDLTLLLDVPAEVGMQRAEKRGVQKDRIEQEKMEFFIRVRNGYLARAKADPKRIKIINANRTMLGVEEQIKQQLEIFLANEAQ